MQHLYDAHKTPAIIRLILRYLLVVLHHWRINPGV